MKRMVADETRVFLRQSQLLREELDSLSLTNQEKVASFVQKLSETVENYNASFITRYFDPQTEIRACISKRLRYLATHYLELYQSLIQKLLSLFHYPITDVSLSEEESLSSLSEQQMDDVATFVRSYLNVLQDMRTRLPDLLPSSMDSLEDCLDELLKPIRARFIFHFILNDQTNAIAASNL